ncbi:MAG: hypothetical protein WC455_03945 [Dehalococcoidia bacterium]
MENELTKALQTSGIIIAALFVISIIFVLAIGSLHHVIAFREKHGIFMRRGRIRSVKADMKKDVLIAAAIEGYLQAEQERKR